MVEVLIVTGGSRGIGAAAASLAAERGYAVCVNYLQNQEAAQNLVSSLRQKGGKAIAVAADMASQDEVVRLFQTVDEQLGRVTALVDNAGTLKKLLLKGFASMRCAQESFIPRFTPAAVNQTELSESRSGCP